MLKSYGQTGSNSLKTASRGLYEIRAGELLEMVGGSGSSILKRSNSSSHLEAKASNKLLSESDIIAEELHGL